MTTSPAPPAVSVLMPAYNAGDYLDEAIRSVLAQGLVDIEILVVDDGSTDDTAARASAWVQRDSRIRLIRQENRGIAAARNAALRIATAPVLALLDSDDVWMRTYLAEQLRLLQQYPEIAVLSANALNRGGSHDGRPLRPSRSSLPFVRLTALDLILHEDAMCVLTIFRREVVDAIGGFDERLRRSEDYDFWIRAALAGFTVAFNPKPLARYRRRENGVSADESLMLDSIRTVLMRIRDTYHGCGDVRDAVDRQYARLTRRALIVQAKRALAAGDFLLLQDRFRALRETTGRPFYALAAVLSGVAPQLIRWMYIVKRFGAQVRRAMLSTSDIRLRGEGD